MEAYDADRSITCEQVNEDRGTVRWGALSVVAMGHFLADMYQNFLPPLLPLIGLRLGLSLTMCGVIVSVASFSSSLTQPVFGHLSDRGMHNSVLIPCVVWSTVLMSSLFWLPGFWWLLVIALLGGLGNALYHPQGSVATASVSGRNKGLGIAVYATAGNLGYTLSPLFVIWAVTALQLPMSYALLVLPGVIGVLLMLGVGLQRMPVARAETPTTLADTWRFFKEEAGHSLMRLNGVVSARSWAMYSLIVFVPHLLIRRGYTDLEVGWLLTAFLIAGTFSGMLGGMMSDRWGRSQTIAATTGIGAVMLMAGLVVPGAWGLVVLIMGSAVIQASFPAAIALAQELSPGHRAMASGMMMGFAWGVGGLGATLTGMMADWWGIVPALMVSLMLLLPVSVWVWRWRDMNVVG